MIRRKWVGSGDIEEFDLKQERLLEEVLKAVKDYYRDLYQTRDCFRYPLTLARLMRMCKRNSHAMTLAVKTHANSSSESETSPPLSYDRIASGKNASHRPYRIFLSKQKTD